MARIVFSVVPELYLTQTDVPHTRTPPHMINKEELINYVKILISKEEENNLAYVLYWLVLKILMVSEDHIYYSNNSFIYSRNRKFCAVCGMNKTVVEKNLLHFNFFSITKYIQITFFGINSDTVWFHPIIDVNKIWSKGINYLM